MDRQTGRRLVQGLLPPCRHLRRERFLRHIDLLVRISALFRGLERHEPMHVRVREVQDQLAWLALATPFPDLAPGLSPGSFTHEGLCQPYRQTLLSDSPGTL